METGSKTSGAQHTSSEREVFKPFKEAEGEEEDVDALLLFDHARFSKKLQEAPLQNLRRYCSSKNR